MQIESLNAHTIIMEYNGEKYKIIPARDKVYTRQLTLECELIIKTVDEIKFDDKIYLRLKKNILYNKKNNSITLISLDRYKFDGFKNIIGDESRIESKNDKFEYYINYYSLNLPLGDNFTKDGLILNNETVFKVFKKFDNYTLLKLRDIFIKKNIEFLFDVYKSKDIDRKYKIFYENEYIKIQEESKEEIKKESEKPPKKESEEESKPAIVKIQPQEQPKEEAPPAEEAGQPQPIQQPGQLKSQRIQIRSIQLQESDDDETISDFSDNSIDESESED